MGLGELLHGLGWAGQLVVADGRGGEARAAPAGQHDDLLALGCEFVGAALAPAPPDGCGPLPQARGRDGGVHRGRVQRAGRDGLAVEAAEDGTQQLDHGAAVAHDVVHHEEQGGLRGVRQEAGAPGQAALQRERLVEAGAVPGLQRVAVVEGHAELHPVGVVEQLVHGAVIGQDAQAVAPRAGLDHAAQAREGGGEFAQCLPHQGFVDRAAQAQDIGLVDGAEVALTGPVQVLGSVQWNQVGGAHGRAGFARGRCTDCRWGRRSAGRGLSSEAAPDLRGPWARRAQAVGAGCGRVALSGGQAPGRGRRLGLARSEPAPAPGGARLPSRLRAIAGGAGL